MKPEAVLAICLAVALPAEPATITGRVTVLGSRAGLGGVTVRVKQKDVILKWTLTNADGAYQVEGLPESELSAEYQLVGYQDNPANRPVKLTAAKPFVQDVRMIAEDGTDAYYASVAESIAAEHYDPGLVRTVRKLAAKKVALVERRWLELDKDTPHSERGMRYASGGDDNPIVISIGPITIRKVEFETALRSLPKEYQSYTLGSNKRKFAEDYLRMKVLAQQGERVGLDRDPSIERQLGLIRENLVANAELARIEKDIDVSEMELRGEFARRRNEYEEVTARHILVAFKGSPAAQPGKPVLTQEEAKAKAEDLRNLLVAGADFGALATKESDDVGSGSRGGNLGAFGRGQMVPAFDKVAFETRIGEVSPVFRTQYGYHILQVQSHTTKSFEEARVAIEKEVRAEKMREVLAKMQSDAKFDAAYFETPSNTPAQATSKKH